MTKSKTFYKILSLIIAIALWSYVVIEVNPPSKKTFDSVPVKLLNEESLKLRGLAIAGEQNFNVSVNVKGNRTDLAKLKKGDIEVSAGLYGYSLGSFNIPVDVALPDGVKLVDISPSKILVNIEELTAVSKPVKVIFNGATAGETEIGDVSIKPEEIEVTGARSMVNQVKYIKAEVAATRFSKSGNRVTAKGIPVDTLGQQVQNVSLSSNYVNVSAKAYSVKEVPLHLQITGEVSNLYEVTSIEKPDTIKIRGSKEDLKNINEVEADPIDISNITDNKTIKINPILPKGIEVSDESKDLAVNITLKGITTKSFDYSAYEIVTENVPDTLSVAIDVDKVIVKISGKESVMQNISKSDFVPYIDLTGATTDTAIAKISVKYDKRVNLVEADPAEVQIKLSEVQQ